MTKEKILEKLVGIGIGTKYMDFNKYAELVESLKQDIRDENNKKAGKVNNAKLAKSIIKSAIKNYPIRDQKLNKMAYCKIIDGVQYFIDGHRIAAFYNPMDFPEWELDWFDILRFIEPLDFEDEFVEIPSLGELKAGIKIAKANGKKSLLVLECGVVVNTQFIVDCLEGLSDVKVHISSTNPKKSPIYVESPDGFGIILPINTAEDLTPGLHETA